MIDYDDAGDFAMFGPVGIVGLIIVIILFVCASMNDDDCQKKKCANGEPRLMNHDCLCVEKAK